MCSAPYDKEAEAKAAGADYVGLDEYITKIEQGWVDMDVVITMPAVMAKVGKLGRSTWATQPDAKSKTGTVTNDIGKAVTEVKGGKIDFKLTKKESFMLQLEKYRLMQTKFMRMQMN